MGRLPLRHIHKDSDESLVPAERADVHGCDAVQDGIQRV